jgi:hypothetical protein
MKFADLSPEIVERIKTLRYDNFIEKHEGPESWEADLRYGNPEFIEFDGRHVLLPVDGENLPNISLLRLIVSEDGNTLTLFLKDTSYYDDNFFSGRLAICEKMRGTDFYIAIVYHEWFIVENKDLR